ncbi:MFS transporter [Amycolatopsis sp. NPDC023774]|uniref:MFS transporter n=1 Tax=Amycolatopsis carbonis TaxID=715471 RepID=A0A9Y2IF21_9PSEU|nr:MFS transporter [Amycolatopsis sp. 2-15]WIX79190.1 MFS transporter [Amycolatopsis sp. 2-15]
MKVAEVLRNRHFDIYWGGVVLSQIGSRGTIAANLYQVYELSGSVAQTGLVGAAQVAALVVLSPLGGVYADRVDRRKLLQWAQAVAMVVAVALAATSFTGHADVLQVVTSVVLTTAAASFDQPARQALIPALVPRAQLPQAFALLNPSRELAVLLGPAVAGVLIAVSGPGMMYAVDAATYLLLMVTLAVLRIPELPVSGANVPLRVQFTQGVRFVLGRRIVSQMVLLDLVATVFAAYRVLLPALAVNRFHLGATAYGLLSAAPSAGALLATYTVFRVVDRSKRLGRVLLYSTIAYGLSAVLLAYANALLIALLACLLLGVFDAMATTIRQAAVQLETPDDMRGRVSAIYQMASRGGPALGDTVIGGVAAAIGPVLALMIGGLATVAFAIGHFGRSNPVRKYARAQAEEPTQA